MLRVGHGGAGAVARANTLASFEAALELGVDMIEFDVRVRRGRLVVAHTPFDARVPGCLSLDRALAHLATPRFAELRFDADVKQIGGEAALLDALERSGLTDRVLVSSQLMGVLDRVRALDPSVRTGVSIGGRVLRHLQRWGGWRAGVLEAVAARRFDAVMAHHTLVDATLSEAVRERGGELFAWTVDDRAGIARLRDAGVTGVITNDPRLFATA